MAGFTQSNIHCQKIEEKIFPVIISMVVLKIESTKKTVQYVYLGFSGGGQGR